MISIIYLADLRAARQISEHHWHVLIGGTRREFNLAFPRLHPPAAAWQSRDDALHLQHVDKT